MSNKESLPPFRVLCLDGGGMRGLYTAAYLSCLSEGFAKKRKMGELDIGKGFDLIVGTSTGAIIACALAVGIPPKKVADFYREHGKYIFPRAITAKLGWTLVGDAFLGRRRAVVKSGENALRTALIECFSNITLEQVFCERKIALAVPAVELGNHNSWVFKTPHLINKTNGRDDKRTLVEVCLATTAAPLFRSLAAISPNSATEGTLVFADGGLWANNPVLVGLIDALEMSQPDQAIEVFSLGTCPLPAGEDTATLDVHRGLREWKFGAGAVELAIDAQEFAYDKMAGMLCRHLKQKCTIVRFPREKIPAAIIQYLGLDDTRVAAADALARQAHCDANMTNSRCGDPNDAEGVLVQRLFMEIPELTAASRILTTQKDPSGALTRVAQAKGE